MPARLTARRIRTAMDNIVHPQTHSARDSRAQLPGGNEYEACGGTSGPTSATISACLESGTDSGRPRQRRPSTKTVTRRPALAANEAMCVDDSDWPQARKSADNESLRP